MKPLDQVASVYSGINGRCCCGCAGKHTFSSRHRQWSEKNRGYSVDDGEVNDRTVKMIYNKVVKAIENGNLEFDELNFTSAVVGNRLYCIYWVHDKS